MKVARLSAFVASVVFGATLGAPEDAQAWWVRYGKGEVVSDDPSWGRVIPVPDSSSMPKTAIKVTNVHVFHGSGTWTGASPCNIEWNTGGYNCHSITYAPSGTGAKTIQLFSGFGQWSNASHFAFINFHTNSSGNPVSGVYFSDS